MVFGWWKRKGQWRTFTGREGFRCQFTDKPTRTANRYERAEGILETVVYRVVDNKVTHSVTVRQGTALDGLSHAQSIQAWLAEFQESMAEGGASVQLVDERPLVGRSDGRALVFHSRGGAVLLRFALIPQVSRLFVCAAIGPREQDAVLQQFVEGFSVV